MYITVLNLHLAYVYTYLNSRERHVQEEHREKSKSCSLMKMNVLPLGDRAHNRNSERGYER